MTQDEFQKKVLDHLGHQDTSQKEVLNRLDTLEKGMQEQKERLSTLDKDMQEQKKFNKKLLFSHDGMVKLIEREVIDRLDASLEGGKVYTDYKIQDHEKRLHSKRF